MAPKDSANTASDAPKTMTESELRFVKAVFDNMTQKPDANWDAVASTLSLKDAKCAKERWRQMSVRHGWRDGGSGNSPRKATAAASGTDKVTKKPARPRTPRKKANKVEDDVDIKSEEEDEDMKPTIEQEV